MTTIGQRLRDTPSCLLDLSTERDLWFGRLLAAEAASYRRGWEDGVAAGRRLEAAERDAAWHAVAQPIARGMPFAEPQTRRWSLRGESRTRAEFSRPHPADYPGEAE
jgi:hypothetical protein